MSLLQKNLCAFWFSIILVTESKNLSRKFQKWKILIFIFTLSWKVWRVIWHPALLSSILLSHNQPHCLPCRHSFISQCSPPTCIFVVKPISYLKVLCKYPLFLVTALPTPKKSDGSDDYDMSETEAIKYFFSVKRCKVRKTYHMLWCYDRQKCKTCTHDSSGFTIVPHNAQYV